MDGKELRLAFAQYDIVWENKAANLDKIESFAKSFANKADILVLPEMCTTGFTMNSCILAETTNEETIARLKDIAHKYEMAICGSYIAKDEDNYFNRGFFITPSDEQYYDKRHLFRMGQEPNHYSSGKNRLIVEHKGFSICLMICYDLRFPVWSRNIDNEYDILIYVANWPASRSNAWNILLEARAIENMCYVCGVNRMGRDGNGLAYDGSSKVINARGEIVSKPAIRIETAEVIHISKDEIDAFRAKFPVWKDADKFKIE